MYIFWLTINACVYYTNYTITIWSDQRNYLVYSLRLWLFSCIEGMYW